MKLDIVTNILLVLTILLITWNPQNPKWIAQGIATFYIFLVTMVNILMILRREKDLGDRK